MEVNNVPRRPSEEEAMRMAEIFKLIGDVTRVKILLLLVNNEMTVRDIAEKLNLKMSRISHQLRLLRSMRLVRYRREGRNVYYMLQDEHVVKLLNTAYMHVCGCEGFLPQEE